jgi:hypothetical protein
LRIRASHDRLWAIVDDLSLIPKYHPEVGKVDLLSGQSTRATGVKYRCTILEGRKGSCVEEVVDYVPGKRLATAFPERPNKGMNLRRPRGQRKPRPAQVVPRVGGKDTIRGGA